MNAYELLSAIYGILGSTDKQTLADARRISDSVAVSRVIDAIAAAWVPTRDGEPPGDSENSERPGELATSREHQGAQSGANRELVHTLQLLNSAEFPITKVVGIIYKMGLRLAPREKEARRRYLGRVTKAVSLWPPSRQRAAVRDLRRALGIDETAGWIEAIRSGHSP